MRSNNQIHIDALLYIIFMLNLSYSAKPSWMPF